jgi:GGDEF domain-containing protein
MDQTEDMENGQILQLQQRIIDDQDQDLDHLSDAIRRQRELGLLIGDELETHAQIIDETEEMVDRTDERLRQAKKKLDYVGRKVKDNSKLFLHINPMSKNLIFSFDNLYRVSLYSYCINYSFLHFGWIVSLILVLVM